MSKNLNFTDLAPLPNSKMPGHLVSSARNNAILGTVRFYAQWRKYVFAPRPDTIFADDCLQEIAEYVTERNRAYRANLAVLKQQRRQA